MASEALTYHGFLETEMHGNPVLARARTVEARVRAKRENSGGVIFLTEDEMPSLKELLVQGDVKSAVIIESPPPADDGTSVEASSPADWRGEAQRRLEFNLEIADQRDIMDENFVFLAALPAEELDAFLDRANGLLGEQETSEEAWLEFLDGEARRADEAMSHQSIPLESHTPDFAETSWQPLISLNDLGINFTRGALGGRRPLADLAGV